MKNYAKKFSLLLVALMFFELIPSKTVSAYVENQMYKSVYEEIDSNDIKKSNEDEERKEVEDTNNSTKEEFKEEKPGTFDSNNSINERMELALKWLKDEQNSAGYWGTSDTKLFYTSEMMEIEKYFKDEINMDKVKENFNEDRIASDSQSRGLAFSNDEEMNRYIDLLKESQNNDGGWGSQNNFDSNVWDTLIVCKNLIKYKKDMKEEISKGIVYILNNQNKEGAFSYLKDEKSDVYLTAQIILLFYDYMEQYNSMPKLLVESSQMASNYILKEKNETDFWGLSKDGLKSSIEAFRALIKTKGINTQKDFIDKLISLQGDKGNYYDDIYTTILAVKALSEIDLLTSDEIHEIEFLDYKNKDENGVAYYDGFTRVSVEPSYKLHDANEVYLSIYFEDENGKSILANEENGIYYFDLENSLAGNYTVVAQVKEKASGNVTTSLEEKFIVNKQLKILSGYNTINPNKLLIGENKEVSNYVSLEFKCNFDAELSVKTNIKSAIDNSTNTLEGKIRLDHIKNQQVFEIIKMSPKTEVGGYYTVENQILYESNKLFEDQVKLNIVKDTPSYTPEITSSLTKEWLKSSEDETEMKFNIFGGNNDVENSNGLDLMILIDNSPSMDWGNMFEKSREAAKQAIDLLGEDDRVGVIKFSYGATCVTEDKNNPSGLLKDKDKVKQAIDDIKYRENSTSIKAGVDLAREQFKLADGNRNKAVLIIADGDENVSSVSSLKQSVKDAHNNENIRFNCIALGTELTEQTLIDVANIGDGLYSKAPTSEQIEELMLDVCGQMVQLTGRKLKFVTKLNEKYMSCIDSNSTSEEVIDGSKYLYWESDKLNCNENKEISLKFKGQNMPDNTKLDIVDEAYLEYLDNQGTRKRINVKAPSVWVSDYKFSDNINLDKDKYKPLEDVSINGVGKNLSKKFGLYKVVYNISDENGTVIESLSDNKILFDDKTENKYEFKWNTQKLNAGKYYFNVNYYKDDNYICTNKKEIIIEKDGELSVKTYSDKSDYDANENIKLSSVINNSSNNFIEKDLKLKVYVVGSDDKVIWENSQYDIPELNSYSSFKVEDGFNIGDVSPGKYKIVSKLLRGEEVVCKSENEFNVMNSSIQGKGVIGNITLNKREVNVGENLDISYKIENRGNTNIDNKNIYLEILDSSENVVEKLDEKILKLNKGESISYTTTWENDLQQGGIYVVGLYMDIESVDGTKEKKLVASEVFNVKVPCKVLIEERNEWSQWIQSNTIYPQFRITNEFNIDLDLSKFKIKYYYTSEGISDDIFMCDWATNGRNNIIGDIIKIPNSNKRILEISFANNSGVVKPGEYIDIQTRILKQSWNDSFNQSDDYSFNKDSITFRRWENITGYFEDSKVWGIEPKNYN